MKDPLGTLKNFGKIRTVPKKNRKGGLVPLVSSGFVGYLKKVRNERDLHWRDLALGLSGFRSFSKKLTDQCESEEKKSLVVGHFSLKGKRAD